MNRTPPWARSPWRWLRRLAWVLGGAWAVYLLAMNVFIRTRIFRNLISSDPDTILVDYASAYSILPLRIHVTDLHIRGRDSHIEWILVLDRCDFTVRPLDFLHRRFAAKNVQGDGLSLRVRQREPAFTPEEALAIPPVPGFSDPPYSGVKPPPVTDADYHLWSIWLEGVVAEHVREIWIDTVRYSGDMRVAGRWYFKPVRWLDVGPATVDVRNLEVSEGMRESWASAAAGQLLVTIHPGDVREYDGGKILGYVSVSGQVHTTVHGGTLANHLARKHGVKVLPADAPVDAKIALEHGVLKPGTEIRVDPTPATAEALGLDVHATLDAYAIVEPDGQGRATVGVAAAKADVAKVPRATAAYLGLELTSRELDLQHPFDDTRYVADVERARIESLGDWMARVPTMDKLGVDSGPVEASGHVRGTVASRTARGTASVHVLGARVWSRSEPIRATSDATAEIALDASMKDRRFDLSGSRVELTRTAGELHGVKLLSSSLELRAERLVKVPAGILGRVSVDAPDMTIPSLASLRDMLPLPKGVAIDSGSGRARGKLDVDLGDGTATGWLHLGARGVHVHVGSMNMTGDLDAELKAQRATVGTDLAGSYASFHEGGTDGWWARFDVSRGVLASPGGPRLRAYVTAAAKDASPITALLDSDAGLAEKLALGVVSTSRLRASGELVMVPSIMEARAVSAESSGFALNLELAKRGQASDLAMYLVVGPVSAGVDVQPDGTHVILFGAQPWYAAKVASMRQAQRDHP